VTTSLPGASAVTSQTSIPAPIPTSSALPTSTPSTGLSTAGKIGLGAALGAAALIALVVLGLFYRRKRNQKRAGLPQELAYEPYAGQGGAPDLPEQREEHYKHELSIGSNTAKHEMPAQTAVEVHAGSQEKPAELIGDIGRR
jgi:hypothetical protein